MGRHPRDVRARLRGPRPYHRPCGHRMIETTAAPFPTIRVRPWLGRLAVAASLIATFMALVWAPTDAVQGDVYRIIYVHVPLAWLAYLAFFVVFLASLGWLWTKRPWFDALAVASAEVGVLFTGMFIVAGSIWAKPTWGVWWTWDPRLVTTAIMFMMYVGYLLLRSVSTDFARRATRAAVVGVIAVIDIPIVLRAGGSPALDATMGMTLGISVIAFTFVYLWFLAERMSIELERQRRMLEAR